MIWILILIAGLQGVATQEFYTQEACEQARNETIKTVRDGGVTGKLSVVAICTPKGTTR